MEKPSSIINTFQDTICVDNVRRKQKTDLAEYISSFKDTNFHQESNFFDTFNKVQSSIYLLQIIETKDLYFESQRTSFSEFTYLNSNSFYFE